MTTSTGQTMGELENWKGRISQRSNFGGNGSSIGSHDKVMELIWDAKGLEVNKPVKIWISSYVKY